jgi:CRP/FNR family transcriptional regulator, cyclic AMP receptor protein
MTRTHFAEGQVLLREGDPPDCVFRVLSGAVDVFREIDGEPILLGTVGAGQFIGEMGVVENRSRSASARAASEVEVEILTPTEFFDQIAGSPQAARELIQRLSQRLREADDRIVKDERRNGRPHATDADSQTALVVPANNPYLAAKDPWLQRQFDAKLALTDLPFVVGRGPVARAGEPPLHPNLKLDDTVPFRLSRNHFMIEKRRDGSYYVHDLRSTLGTIVNGQPIGEHFRSDDAPLRAGENEVIAGGVDSRFVFSVFIA